MMRQSEAAMNMNIPDWSSSMRDTFAPLGGEDDGLIELMWCNGHVVMQSQAPPRKPPLRPDNAAAAAQAWFQYPVEEEDPLERDDDLFAELFGEAQAAVDGGSSRGACCKEEEEAAERGAEAAAHQMMPPPQQKQPSPAKACSPGDGAAAAMASAGCEATATATATEGAESSMLTIGSSFCGSNHVHTPPPPPPPPARARAAVMPPCLGPATAKDAASATRSRSCTTKGEQPGPGAASGAAAAAAAHRSGNKRKQSDATDTAASASASIDDRGTTRLRPRIMQDVELESAAGVTCEPPQKMSTAKRRRAAEVHNLSERRRRDRINEKMKALQELIPHCNKADKASMLDEAIEYLKSLQLQLQMMWMGGGMAPPVVFPAGVQVHQYMQRMVAAGPPPPHVAASLPGMPFMAPPAVQAGPPLPDLYARYLAVDHHHHLPPPPPPPPMVAPPYTVELLITFMNLPIGTPPPLPLLFADRFQQHCLQAAMGFYQRQNPALPPPPPVAPPSDGILHKKYENYAKPEIQGMTG